MTNENPFDLLGLKKEVVELLHRQGKLDGYLKEHFHFSQNYLHPDKGGSNDLSAKVNGAYETITHYPKQIAGWIQGMQNGNSQYKSVLEKLLPEMERLKIVEKEYEELRVKYANLLTGNKIDETVRERRVTASSESIESSDLEDDLEDKPYYKEIRKRIKEWYEFYKDDSIWDNIKSLEQISIRNSRGMTLLDHICREYELRGTDVYFHSDGLFDVLNDMESHLIMLKEQGMNPTHYLFDCFLVESWSNCYEKYVYSVTFLKN